MDRQTFWKNYELGSEISISGSLIYNGIYAFHQIRDFNDAEENIFEFFYNISVGFERLMKIMLMSI